MRIIGIDPGTTITGIGIVDCDDRGDCSPVFFGVLKPGRDGLARGMARLHRELADLVTTWQPETAAVEGVFYGVNVKSTVTLAHARGVALAVLGEAGLSVAEYSPAAVKKTLAGYGQADKEQIRFLVEQQLGVSLAAEPLDVSDALAIAICHGQHLVFGGG